MKIFVTGGTGNVGRAAVARLVRNGFDVKVIGRRSGVVIEDAEYRSCDINDFDGLMREMEGCDAVVHLAAIPHPSGGPGQEIFRVNCQGSFNVYQAAANLGIKRVVSASSINAFGFNFGVKAFDLVYFPIDEEHPRITTDPYSFSKQILEEIAEYFWHRDGISGVCLRLPFVYEMNDERRARMAESVRRRRESLEELFSLPESERKEIVAGIWEEVNNARKMRANEKPRHRTRREQERSREEHRRFHVFGLTDFWASIDAEDSAQAIEKGITADYEGSHPIFVNDSHNSTGVESEKLLQLFYPEVKRRKRPLIGTETIVSIDKARALIGFEPEHSISRWF